MWWLPVPRVPPTLAGFSMVGRPPPACCSDPSAPSRSACAVGQPADPRPVRPAGDPMAQPGAVRSPPASPARAASRAPLAWLRTAPEPAGHRFVVPAPAWAWSQESDWGRAGAAALARWALPEAVPPAGEPLQCVRSRTPALDHEGCRWAAVRWEGCPDWYHSLSSSSTSLLTTAESVADSGGPSSWSSADAESSSTGASGSS